MYFIYAMIILCAGKLQFPLNSSKGKRLRGGCREHMASIQIMFYAMYVCCLAVFSCWLQLNNYCILEKWQFHHYIDSAIWMKLHVYCWIQCSNFVLINWKSCGSSVMLCRCRSSQILDLIFRNNIYIVCVRVCVACWNSCFQQCPLLFAFVTFPQSQSCCICFDV